MERNFEMRFMQWVFVDGIKFFGPGRAELLGHIQDMGSIAQAAKVMGMSYEKAWRMVDEMNTMGKNPYVVAQKGGKLGGGTELTETGKIVLAAYKKLNSKLRAVLEEETELPTLI